MSTLQDSDLPAFFREADMESNAAQRATLRATQARLGGAVAAAVGGAFSLTLHQIDVWAWIALIGFLVALISELFLALATPEKRWYQARAGAESAKTLSWRFSVGADPFFLSLGDEAADSLFRQRVIQVARQVTDSVQLPKGDATAPSDGMIALRRSSLENRRVTYLRDRTRAQRDWYTDKAKFNRSRAVFWRVSLIAAEVIAVVLAAGRVFAGWEIDVAGILAALIGAGAAWLAVKQHSTLRAAYSLTAAELERQMVSVRSANSEATWAQSVADAEEAISREHTMWLASRGEVNEDVGRAQL
ncbi:DUF4231 domain-containing protein [Microbacterium sp. CFBP9023]|uniref:DUF4231 domain-containing protein n=1 Tax=Microbacterium sp. CFBP9023 TaxID=3096535 RepID=UPI002A6AC3BE|nr:DUF4231 domain-containing protein [Microbacterium sp. CFBP9023]MDY0985150.1 DUF4231 domain-containing protein [Microbacterium sp. CFBP9023]